MLWTVENLHVEEKKSKEAIRSLKRGDNGCGTTMGIQRVMESQCDDLMN